METKDGTTEDRDDKQRFSWDDNFYGAVTVGERGQVVIPASARKRFHIEPGDKLLIMGDPGKRGLMLCKLDELREFMNIFQESLARVEKEIGASNDRSTDSAQGDSDTVESSAFKGEEV